MSDEPDFLTDEELANLKRLRDEHAKFLEKEFEGLEPLTKTRKESKDDDRNA